MPSGAPVTDENHPAVTTFRPGDPVIWWKRMTALVE